MPFTKDNFNKFHFLIFILITSFIPIFYVYKLLFYGEVLPGNDPTNHVMYSMYYIFPIPYSQFYKNLGFYPSMLQLFWSFIYLLTKISVIDIIKYSMFIFFVLGFINFAYLSKKISDGNILKGLFILTIISFSISPIIKTFRDGSYGEIFSLWFLLPLFLYFFLNRKIVISSIIASLIIYSHNLSAFLMISIILAIFISDLINIKSYSSFKKYFKNILYFTLITFTLSIAAILIFYLPKIINILQNSQTGFEIYSIPISDYSSILTNLTLYAGIISSIIILIFYKKKFIAFWSLFYFILAQYPPFSPRIERELCIPLAISLGIVTYDFINKILNIIENNKSFFNYNLTYTKKIFTFLTKRKITIIMLLILSIIIINNGLSPIISQSNPEETYYYTNMKKDAYNYLEKRININDKVIVLRTMDSWCKIFLNYGSVYEIISPKLSSSLSINDSNINNELTESLQNPFNVKSLMIFHKYNINYFIISSPLSNRWYDPQDIIFDNILLNINYECSPLYNLVYYYNNSNELIKIYKINYIENII